MVIAWNVRASDAHHYRQDWELDETGGKPWHCSNSEQKKVEDSCPPPAQISAFSVFLSNYLSRSFAPSAGSVTTGNIFYTYYNYNTNKK